MKPLIALLGLLLTLICSTYLLYFLSSLLPLSAGGKYQISFPSDLDHLKELVSLLREFKEEHKISLMLLFCVAYLYKQTFAIPGSVFMNLLAGALFGLWKGFFITCFLTATGASCCFILSKIFGRSILFHYFPVKLKELEEKISENSDGLFFYLLCLRLFPMSPNWFLNMSSPILGISILYFFPSVFIGLMPYNFICCQTGCILSEIQSMNDIFTLSIMLKLVSIAMLVGIVGFCAQKFKNADKISKSK